MEYTIPEISIIIVGHQSKKYLDTCLLSIKHQTIYNSNRVEVFYINNGEYDGSIHDIQRNYRWVATVRNLKHAGFPAAINQGIRYASGDYILVMHPDTILEKDFLENALETMNKEPKLGAVSGKIYLYDLNKGQKMPYFDSVGTFAMVDREILSARGAEDVGQFEEAREIFAVKNTCALYRRSALEDIRIDDEYFDEDFFMYFEDRDACWRLRLMGWKVMYDPHLVASHCIDNKKKMHVLEYRDNERKYMLKNDRLMTIKNEFLWNMVRDFHIIFRKRWRKKGFYWSGKGEYMRQIPRALHKRRLIMKKKRAKNHEIRKWFIKKRSIRYNVYKSRNMNVYAQLPPVY